MPHPPIVIAGAGIGGLCAAHALRRRAQAVCVVERATELRGVGAGIVLSTNAMRALASLGLDEAVRAAGTPLHRGQLRRHNGTVLQTLALARIGARYGQPSVAIHRAALQRVLAEPLGADILLGAQVIGFSQESAGVTVHMQTRNDLIASLLVGADGLRSRVRTTLWGDAEARYAGYTCWRGVAEADGSMMEPGTSLESWGRGLRFGAATLGPQQVYWFAVANAPAGRLLGAEAGHSEVARLFADWHDPIPALIQATPPAAVLHNDIFDRPPILPWGRDDVTLLGDAAHPTTPNMGQGAGMAVEDAVVLASQVARHGCTPRALRAYEVERHDRTAQVVQSSYNLGRVAQASHPALCAVRDLALRVIPGWVAAASMRRLFAFEPPDQEL